MLGPARRRAGRAEWPDLLQAVRRRIDATSQNLPNFVCRRRTERFERLFRGWREKDRFQEELLFTNGEESYQPVEGQKASGSQDGTYSIGEFAAALRNVFAPESRTSFRPEEAEEISGRQTLRVAYRVPQEASSLQLTYEGNPLRVGYRGLCWIDVNSHQVVRLTKELVDLPEDFPIKASEMSIAYDRIRIGGGQHCFRSGLSSTCRSASCRVSGSTLETSSGSPTTGNSKPT